MSFDNIVDRFSKVDLGHRIKLISFISLLFVAIFIFAGIMLVRYPLQASQQLDCSLFAINPITLTCHWNKGTTQIPKYISMQNNNMILKSNQFLIHDKQLQVIFPTTKSSLKIKSSILVQIVFKEFYLKNIFSITTI